MQIQNAIITGSFSYNGTDLSNVTSSNAYSASLSSRTTDLESTSSVLVGASASFSSILSSVSSSQQQISASLLQVSASYIALSGSYTTFSGSASTRVTQIETVYATTGSNSFRATQSITGSLTVTGQIIAQTINVQQVTSSIIYSSGSNVFGCDLNSRQTFTGSVLITGSLTIAGALTGTSATFRVSADRNLAVKYDSNITISAQADAGGPESIRMYADTFRIYTSTTAVGLTERFTISNTGIASFSCQMCVPKLQVQGPSGCDAFGTFLGGAGSTLAGIKIGNDTSVYGSLYFDNATNDVLLLQQYATGNLRLGTNSAERMRITNSGIACFACQVCAPSYISSNASNISYQDGQYIVGNSESEVCTLGPATSAYVPMKYWIADRTGTIRTKFAAYIVSGPNYWAYQFRKNASCVIATGHYNSTLEPGQTSNVHAYTTFTNVLCSLSPGDCITYEMASANSGGTPTNGSGTQCFYVKELRFLSNSPSISNNYTNNVFGEWVGLGTSCPLSNLEIRNSNEAAYDASVDNGQDGCGVTMTIRNGNTTTNSFAQLNLQVSGDSGRAVGRIVLIRKESASSHMAFVTETANTKVEIMRLGCYGASSHNFIMVGRTNAGISAGTGITLNASTGQMESSVNGDDILNLNRNVSDGKIIRLFKNCSEVGSISTNTYSLPSDANFKTNINSLNLGLNLVSKLRPVSYNHKLDDSGSALSTGFIAQEMQCTLDELGVERNSYFILQHKPVEDQNESQYWVDYTKMIPVLTKAIQEQQCTINTLKTCLGII